MLTLGLLLGLLMLARVPLFVVFLASVLVYLALFTKIPPSIVVQRTFSGLDKFPLMAVPLFVLAANVMAKGGMSSRIIDFAKAIVAALPGGLALAAVLACMLFGALSGSSPATVIAIGAIMYPALLRSGYPSGFASGLLTASASTSAIIPPSIGMIVYGTVASVSVGQLFIAAIVPGLLYGGALMLFAFCYCYFKGYAKGGNFSFSLLRHTLFKALWALGVPVIIIGGIYGGVMTPTEAAAIAAVYTIVVALFIDREISVRDLVDIFIDSAAITAQIMILIGAASALSWFLTIQRVPVEMAQWLTSFVSSEIGMLLMINLILIIAGMFLDPTSVAVIFAPLLLPIAGSLGLDPVHLGVIVLMNGAVGMFTPPFGFNLFVATSIFNTPLARLAITVLPFIAVSMVAVLLVTFLPGLSLWLPEALGMR